MGTAGNDWSAVTGSPHYSPEPSNFQQATNHAVVDMVITSLQLTGY